MMLGLSGLCLACIFVQVKEKLALIEHRVEFQLNNQQVSPLPVESSLPPINWDNIKAKCVSPFPFCQNNSLLIFSAFYVQFLLRYPTVTPWAPGSKLPPGFLSQDSLGPPAPVPHPGYKKGTKR